MQRNYVPLSGSDQQEISCEVLTAENHRHMLHAAAPILASPGVKWTLMTSDAAVLLERGTSLSTLRMDEMMEMV